MCLWVLQLTFSQVLLCCEVVNGSRGEVGCSLMFIWASLSWCSLKIPVILHIIHSSYCSWGASPGVNRASCTNRLSSALTGLYSHNHHSSRSRSSFKQAVVLSAFTVQLCLNRILEYLDSWNISGFRADERPLTEMNKVKAARGKSDSCKAAQRW